jgi:hypothetical protein
MQDPFRLSGRAIKVPPAPMPVATVTPWFTAASYLLLVPGIPAAIVGVMALLFAFDSSGRLPFIVLLTFGLTSGIAIMVRSVIAPAQLRKNQANPVIVTGIWTILHNVSQLLITVVVTEPTPDAYYLLPYPLVSIAYGVWQLTLALPLRYRLHAWQAQEERRQSQVARLVLGPEEPALFGHAAPLAESAWLSPLGDTELQILQ